MADKKIQIKHKNGEIWDQLFPVTKAEYVELADDVDIETSITNIKTGLTNKVDKVTGKVLSSNDYTDTEKTKLSGLSDHSTDITDIQTDIAELESNKADKTSVYTQAQVDTLISDLERMPIPVQTTAPTDSDLWFEELA